MLAFITTAVTLTGYGSVVYPEAVVVQCGADCLVGDDIGTWLRGYGSVPVLDWGRPTLLLGGGGCGHMTVT